MSARPSIHPKDASSIRSAEPRSKRPAGKIKASKTGLTPAMQQYKDQKAQVGDAILLFRMGDFYETFFGDAETISRVLGLALTARNKNSDQPIPLAGVPYHAIGGYISKLVRAGYKVAISEQIEDPKQAKGVVKREIQRIITPGTLTDESLLDERSTNYLAALCPEEGDWKSGPIGLAYVELSSGRFFAEQVATEAVADELSRLNAAEVLIPETEIDRVPANLETWQASSGSAISQRPAYVFDPYTAEQALCQHFGVQTLAGFGFDTFDASLSAAAAVLDYLKETQKAALPHIQKIIPRRSDGSVGIDQVTLRSLEVLRTMRDGSRQGSLLDAIDETCNPMGARRFAEWLAYPRTRADSIRARQDAIADLRNQPDRLHHLREHLRVMGDVERIIARVGVGRASPRDMATLGQALLRCVELAKVIGPPITPDLNASPRSSPRPDLLTQLFEDIGGSDKPQEGDRPRLDALGHYLTSALKQDAPPILRDGGFIADGFNAELDRLRSIGTDGQHWLAEFQARQAKETGIGSLKVGYNSVFGYYIEITHQHQDKVPPNYVRRQTLRNCERYITDELKQHENEVLGAADRARQLELELFEQIRQHAAEQLPQMQTAAEALATLDVLGGLAELARCRDYCRPELFAGEESGRTGGTVLEITEGRHPVLDVTLAQRFVPNDCHLSSNGKRLLIITGPNMAGKSTYIRQVALLVLLAQTGSFVPAQSMRWSPVDRIFARVGAGDELVRGQSTFMVEMVETTRILHNATPRSLVILDEIGRGTSTYDGLSLAWAITEYIVQQIGCRTLFATHYHELTELAEQDPGIANYNVAVREQLRPTDSGRDVVFLHKIVPGPADRSYGVHVAAMAGMPSSVLKRSEEILADLEQKNRSPSTISTMSDQATRANRQLTLFGEPAPLPDGWQEVVDALGKVDIDQTTPLDALSLLQRLKGHLHRED